MNALEKARAIRGAVGMRYKKDIDVANARREFSAHFTDSPDYQPETKINDIVQPLIVSKYKSVVTQKRIIAYPGQTFDRGDVVDCYGCKWLITDVDANDNIYTTGMMQQCQKEIKWQNPLTREIHTRWATVEKPYFSNLEEDKRMSISTREFKIQMRYDEETSLIDIGKRLMLEAINSNPKTYRITSVDSMTQRYEQDGDIRGFIVINVEQDAYKADSDNKELMICDYLSPIEEADDHIIRITYSGSKNIRIGTSTKKYTATVFDNSDVIVDEPVVFEIDTDIPADKITFANSGKIASVGVADDSDLVGSKIKLTATSATAHKEIVIEVID